VAVRAVMAVVLVATELVYEQWYGSSGGRSHVVIADAGRVSVVVVGSGVSWDRNP
jgi:hypothetical protein